LSDVVSSCASPSSRPIASSSSDAIRTWHTHPHSVHLFFSGPPRGAPSQRLASVSRLQPPQGPTANRPQRLFLTSMASACTKKATAVPTAGCAP
jgi:hypothetical protein